MESEVLDGIGLGYNVHSSSCFLFPSTTWVVGRSTDLVDGIRPINLSQGLRVCKPADRMDGTVIHS
jgi:hypothetical protein